MGPEARPPGDRNELIQLLEEVREELRLLRDRPPQVLEIKNSWWDSIRRLYQEPAESHGRGGYGSLFPGYVQEFMLDGQMMVTLRVTAQNDGLELTLKAMNGIVWQRKLFYERETA